MAVVPYDPEWPRLFDGERARLENVLAPWLKGGLHHIGSTSVPELAAKPIIDMLAGVGDLEKARETNRAARASRLLVPAASAEGPSFRAARLLPTSH